MKMENTNLNIPDVTVKDVISLLSTLYCNAVNGGVELKNIPSPFLWGAAGVGKSQAVRRLAEEIERGTGKRTYVTDVRLLLFSPVDLRGIPTANDDKTLAVWLRPKIFQMDDSPDVINLLFLDEITAAPQSVQAAAYQITLDRAVGEHRLPDNCIVIAAGNRTTDQSVSYRMPKALCNRLMHFNVCSDYKAWREWAIANGIDSRIVGYLAFDSDKLCVVPGASDNAYPTPRSWAFVSDLLKTLPGSAEDNKLLIGSCIGVETAVEFCAWTKVYDQLPDVDGVLEGRCTSRPRTQDALHAFMASLVSRVTSLGLRISTDQLNNVCSYVNRFPVDFATCFYHDIKACESVAPKLSRCPACRKWLLEHKEAV